MQQLCEAGEAEFLEIMDLVGMASKPMHVRRLQKALQEWVQNPGKLINFTHFCSYYDIWPLDVVKLQNISKKSKNPSKIVNTKVRHFTIFSNTVFNVGRRKLVCNKGFLAYSTVAVQLRKKFARYS